MLPVFNSTQALYATRRLSILIATTALYERRAVRASDHTPSALPTSPARLAHADVGAKLQPTADYESRRPGGTVPLTNTSFARLPSNWVVVRLYAQSSDRTHMRLSSRDLESRVKIGDKSVP